MQLNEPKMQMLISINILDMALDLMEKEFFSHPTTSFGNNTIIFGGDISFLI